MVGKKKLITSATALARNLINHITILHLGHSRFTSLKCVSTAAALLLRFHGWNSDCFSVDASSTAECYGTCDYCERLAQVGGSARKKTEGEWYDLPQEVIYSHMAAVFISHQKARGGNPRGVVFLHSPLIQLCLAKSAGRQTKQRSRGGGERELVIRGTQDRHVLVAKPQPELMSRRGMPPSTNERATSIIVLQV